MGPTNQVSRSVDRQTQSRTSSGSCSISDRGSWTVPVCLPGVHEHQHRGRQAPSQVPEASSPKRGAASLGGRSPGTASPFTRASSCAGLVAARVPVLRDHQPQTPWARVLTGTKGHRLLQDATPGGAVSSARTPPGPPRPSCRPPACPAGCPTRGFCTHHPRGLRCRKACGWRPRLSDTGRAPGAGGFGG